MHSALGRYQLGSWARALALVAAILFGCRNVTAYALTAEQARDLPEQELAKQVLGEAGKRFVEVRRPDWQDGAWLFANPVIAGKAPPLRWLYFYGRPYLPFSSAGVEGLCAAERLRVDFGKNGEVNGLDFDVVGGLSQTVTFGNTPPNAVRQKELEQRCANASAQRFFSLRGASGDVGAVIAAVNQVHEAMTHGGAPWLTLTCDMSERCDPASYAEQTTVNDITGLSNCRPPAKTDDRSHPNDQCWNVGIGGTRCMTVRELTIVLDGDAHPVEIRSAAFREDRIVC